MVLKEGFEYEEASNRAMELISDSLNGLDAARVRGVACHLSSMSDFTARKVGLFLDLLMDLSHELYHIRGMEHPIIWTPNNVD